MSQTLGHTQRHNHCMFQFLLMFVWRPLVTPNDAPGNMGCAQSSTTARLQKLQQQLRSRPAFASDNDEAPVGDTEGETEGGASASPSQPACARGTRESRMRLRLEPRPTVAPSLRPNPEIREWTWHNPCSSDPHGLERHGLWEPMVFRDQRFPINADWWEMQDRLIANLAADEAEPDHETTLTREEMIALQNDASYSTERFAGAASGSDLDQPAGTRCEAFPHPIFGPIVTTEELVALFLTYGMDASIPNRSTNDDAVKVNLNSSLRIPPEQAAGHGQQWWIKKPLWQTKFTVKFSADKGSPDGGMYMWVCGSTRNVRVGVHILRKLMHYYQQDAVNSLRRCRLSMQCTGSVADEAYLNHKRDQDLARARERERERVSAN